MARRVSGGPPSRSAVSLLAGHPGVLPVGAPGAGVVEDQTHDDGIPQLAGPATTVVADEPPFGRKAPRCVEANGAQVVGPYLERHLVRPEVVDLDEQGVEQTATQSASAPVGCDRHPDF